MQSPAYQKAADGDPRMRETRASNVTGLMSKYREAAMRQIRADPEVRQVLAKRLAESRAAVVDANPAPPRQS